MEYLKSLDYSLFSALNGLHSGYFDHLMWLFAAKLAWVPMVLVLLWLCWRKGWKQLFMVVGAIALTVLISDQVASGIIKPIVGRLRPSHDPSLSDTIHLVNGYAGGMYGFVSSHASNSVGCATLLILLFKNRMMTMAMSLWAILVCYCRIYEGVHFPGDIICGAAVGIIAAFIVAAIFRKLLYKYYRKKQLFGDFDAKVMSVAVFANLLVISMMAIFYRF